MENKQEIITMQYMGTEKEIDDYIADFLEDNPEYELIDKNLQRLDWHCSSTIVFKLRSYQARQFVEVYGGSPLAIRDYINDYLKDNRDYKVVSITSSEFEGHLLAYVVYEYSPIRRKVGAYFPTAKKE